MGFIVTKKPGQNPVIVEVKGKEVGYELMTKTVEGHIECIRVGQAKRGNTIDMWLNEEGKLNGMKPNLRMPGDIIVGPILICLGSPGGYSRPFPDYSSAVQIAAQTMAFHIVDPDSVEVPEPHIEFHTFDSMEELQKHLDSDHQPEDEDHPEDK